MTGQGSKERIQTGILLGDGGVIDDSVDAIGQDLQFCEIYMIDNDNLWLIIVNHSQS